MVLKIIDRPGFRVTCPKEIKLGGGDTGILSKLGADHFRMDVWNKKSGGYTGSSIDFAGRMLDDVIRLFK